MGNELATKKPAFSVAIQSDTYKKLINNTLGNPEKAERFIAAISSAVAVNEDLKTCDAGTILAAALLGESLNLSPSPQLGQYYMVGFNNTKKGVKDTSIQEIVDGADVAKGTFYLYFKDKYEVMNAKNSSEAFSFAAVFFLGASAFFTPNILFQ